MSRVFALISLVAALMVTLSFGTAQAAKRIALVVGNGNYVFSPLKNPPGDAKLIARSLERAGFQVALALDQDQRGMKRAVRDFGQNLLAAGEDAVGLFYYAGHGVQVGGDNYMIPVRADIRSESDVEIEAVRVGTILNYMGEAGNRLNFVVMDACRNNPFARSMRSAAQGLARMDAPSGTLIAYATAPGKVALDGSGSNSPYTKALATYITEPGIPVERMFKKVRADVLAGTGRQQVPWESSSLTGDFFFTPAQEKPAPIVRQSPVAPAPTIDLDLETWRSVAASSDPQVISSYLAAFPNGKFAAVARVKIDSLNRQRAAAEQADLRAERDRALQVEAAFWRGVVESRDPAVLQTYLDRYPSGTYAVLAQQKIAALARARNAAPPPPPAVPPRQTAALKPQPVPKPPVTGGPSVLGKWDIYLDYDDQCLRRLPSQNLDTTVELVAGETSINHALHNRYHLGDGSTTVKFTVSPDDPGRLKIGSLLRQAKAYRSGETVLTSVREGQSYEIDTGSCIELTITFKKRLN